MPLSASAPVQEQPEKNKDEMQSKHSKHLDACQILIGNKDQPPLSLVAPDPPELRDYIEPACPEKPASEDVSWGHYHLSLQGPETLNKGTESSPEWADVAVLVEAIQHPQIFHFFNTLDQSCHPTPNEAQDTGVTNVNRMQEKSSITKGPSSQVRKNKHKASQPISGAPEAEVQLKVPESLLAGEELTCSVVASDRAPADTAEQRSRKALQAVSSTTSQAKGRGQAGAKRARENNSKEALERKQSGPKVKAEEKPAAPNKKRKRHQPELGQEAFQMRPRTCLARHMLESVQVFHPLGRKPDKTAGLLSSGALGTSGSCTHPETSPTSKLWQGAACEGKGTERSQHISQNPHSRAAAVAPSASLCDRPPPGKVKLVPLHFPSPEKPPARPVSRRPQPLASRRPTAAHSARPAAPNTAQASQIAGGSTSLMAPVKPAQAVGNNVHQPLWTTSEQPRIPQSAVSKPAPQETSSSVLLRRGSVPTAVTQPRSPPQPQNPFLLQDFSRQPIPWREPNVPEPVVSSPITAAQRPEREVMKRRAQQEQERAAKYTSLGKLQFFKQRGKDREVAGYYGYAR